MAMSDCIKCWETPCRCGYDYRNWSLESLKEFSSMIQVTYIKRLAQEARKIAEPIGSLHSYWDSIFDIELYFQEGGPSIVGKDKFQVAVYHLERELINAKTRK